jgi:predicted signal transduction protein with EAL and GGDEF domain
VAEELPAQFVRDLGTNAGDLAIVGAIIGLAEALGLQLVAQGVETPAAALTLIKHRTTCVAMRSLRPMGVPGSSYDLPSLQLIARPGV